MTATGPGRDAPNGGKAKRIIGAIAGGALLVAAIGVGAVLLSDDDDDDEASTTTTADDDDTTTTTVAPTPETTSPETTAPSGAVPAGFRQAGDPAQGFTLAVPESWQDFDAADLSGQALDDLRAANPDLAVTLDMASGILAQGGVLFAVDPVPSPAGFSSNVNLLRLPLPGAFDAALLDSSVRGQLESQGITDLNFEDIELPAGPAVRGTYVLPLNLPDGSTLDLTGTQYYVGAGSEVWVLTLTTDRPAESTEVFDAIADSFRLV